jgi:hypothetical protein
LPNIPWNKGKTGLQVAWNKGKSGIYSEETKRRIGVAASLRNKGRKLTRRHKKRISLAHAALKICSACSVKSKWIYKVKIPSVSDYELLLCDTDLVEQFHNLTADQKKQVEILS